MSKAPTQFKTERFIVYRHEVKRPEKLGGMHRTVFHAWFHSEDIPRPVCVVTVNESFGDFVEWLEVDSKFRRKGIATEVLRAIEEKIGCLTLSGATKAGDAFCEAYEAKYPSPVE